MDGMRKMKMDIKTKFNAVIAVILLVLSGGLIAGVIGDVYLTDTEMGYSERIVCSNGNTYTATAANLQTAIYSLNGTGGLVQLPVCNITLTTSLQTINNLTLRGVGSNSTLYRGNSVSKHMIYVNDKNVKIEGINFNGNNKSQGVAMNNSIFFTAGSWDCVVRGCTFHHETWHYINTASSSNQGRILIEGNSFYEKQRSGYGGAVMMRGAKNIIRNNYAENQYAFGFGVEGSEAITYDNLIDGNIVTGFTAVGIYCENGHSSNTTIINNIINNINSTAYLVSESFYSIGIHARKGGIISNNRISTVSDVGILCSGNSTISNNWIYNVYDGGSTFSTRGNGIVLDGTISQRDFALLNGNVIDTTTEGGIYCGINASITNCWIKNVVGANNRGIMVVGAATAVSITGCRIENILNSSGIHVEASKIKVVIANNFITNIGQRGIYIYTSKGGIIEGNMVENTIFSGIQLASGASNYAINNNWVNNTGTTDGIYVTGNNVTITGNFIRDADEAIELASPASNVSATGNRAILCNSGLLEIAGSSYNSASNNNFKGCTVQYTIVGTGSWAMTINATTAKIGVITSSGTTWK